MFITTDNDINKYRVTGMESSLACKLDRSDLSQLETLIGKIDIYEEFKQQTISNINKLKIYENESKILLNQHSNNLSDINNMLIKMNYDISNTATKKDAHLLGKEIEIIKNDIKLLSTIEVVQEVQKRTFYDYDRRL